MRQRPNSVIPFNKLSCVIVVQDYDEVVELASPNNIGLIPTTSVKEEQLEESINWVKHCKTKIGVS